MMLNKHTTLSRLRSNGPCVARRKCRGVKPSRTFHPVPGCRQVIGRDAWGRAGEVVDRGLIMIVCCVRQYSSFRFGLSHFGA